MSEVYCRGGDVTVLADGVRVGGVTGAVCVQEHTVEAFGEYLSDVPVMQTTRRMYTIRLQTCARPYTTLGLEPQTVSLECGGTRVVYRDCHVENVKCEILPGAAVTYTVTLTAGERSVEHV